MNALSSTLRFFARFLAVVATVLTFGVGMAWMWDRSDGGNLQAAEPPPQGVPVVR